MGPRAPAPEALASEASGFASLTKGPSRVPPGFASPEAGSRRRIAVRVTEIGRASWTWCPTWRAPAQGGRGPGESRHRVRHLNRPPLAVRWAQRPHLRADPRKGGLVRGPRGPLANGSSCVPSRIGLRSRDPAPCPLRVGAGRACGQPPGVLHRRGLQRVKRRSLPAPRESPATIEGRATCRAPGRCPLRPACGAQQVAEGRHPTFYNQPHGGAPHLLLKERLADAPFVWAAAGIARHLEDSLG
jgi:hypothetical protein